MLSALLIGYILTQFDFVIAYFYLQLTSADAMHFDGCFDYLRPESLQ